MIHILKTYIQLRSHKRNISALFTNLQKNYHETDQGKVYRWTMILRELRIENSDEIANAVSANLLRKQKTNLLPPSYSLFPSNKWKSRFS